MLQCLPEKIRPIVKPLMESIKKESNEMLQVILYIIYISVQILSYLDINSFLNFIILIK